MGDLKREAAEHALQYLEGVEVLGLGTGRTFGHFLQGVAELHRAGKLSRFVGIPTSMRTERLAHQLGIPVSTLDTHPEVDLTVDGADEADPELNLIKGGGGALTREKIVAHASHQYVIIIDESKRVERLGRESPLPIEVLRFARGPLERTLRGLGCEPVLRLEDDEPYRTDEGNFILDCHFPHGIPDAHALDRELNDLSGILEHGLFLGMADRVIVASPSGVQVLDS